MFDLNDVVHQVPFLLEMVSGSVCLGLVLKIPVLLNLLEKSLLFFSD